MTTSFVTSFVGGSPDGLVIVGFFDVSVETLMLARLKGLPVVEAEGVVVSVALGRDRRLEVGVAALVVAARADPERGDGEQRDRRGRAPRYPTFTRSTMKTSVSSGPIGPTPRAP